MKVLCLLMLLFLTGGGDVHKVSKINKAKEKAETAFKASNYKEALHNYQYLTDSLDVTEENVLINKAHCYYKLKDMVKAKEAYAKLSNATDIVVRSVANQQLGILAYEEKNQDLAKNYFKASLKALPLNEEARYNYELLTKILSREDKNENNKKQENKDSEKPFEPSAFAKKLKEQAEALAGSYKYDEAYKTMMDGLKKDKSVLYYSDFINRLKVISDLNKI